MILPPKRYQDQSDHKWDQIRHKDWFRRLIKRRAKVPVMAACYEDWRKNVPQEMQKSICEKWGVDPREMRDYVKFREVAGKPITAPVQKAMDLAYEVYVAGMGGVAIQSLLTDFAEAMGLNPRRLVEAWEINPNFWPTNYPNAYK